MFRYLKATFVFVALTTCCSVLSDDAYAQSVQPSEPYLVVGVDCNAEEHVKSLLDTAAILSGEDKSLIIIARLGAGESSRKLLRGRLYTVSNYLKRERGFSKSRVITAEGERVRGLGHVEVYAGGKLFTIFKMKRNRGFTSGGCYS